MAELAALNLKISADISDLQKELKAGGKSVEQFGAVAAKTGQDVDKKLTTGANRAGEALNNLSRVAQDAPFGFIGIANNLNPLLESFQRLKAESGSSKAALSQLAGSLTGAGGLGLALSVVTAIAGFASMGFSAYTRGLEDTSKKTQKVKDDTESYKKAIDSIFSSTAKEVVNVQSLIAVLDSETESRRRKLAALDELKKIQPEIFDGLKFENGAVVGLTAAYEAYIKQIRTVIAVKIKQQQLEKVTEDILKKEGVTLTQQEAANKSFIDSLAARTKRKAEAARQDSRLAPVAQNIIENEFKANTELNKLYEEQKKLIADIGQLQGGVDVNIQDIKIPKAKADTLKKDLEKVLRGLFLEAFKADAEPIEVPVEVVIPVDKSSLSAGSVATYSALIKDALVNATAAQLPVIQQALKQKFGAAFNLDQLLSNAETYPAVFLEKVKAAFSTIQNTLQVEAEKTRQFYTEISKQFNADILTSLAQGLGNVASGASSIGDAFKGILGIVGDYLIQLGKAAILQSKLFLALKASSTNPFTGLAAGALAIAAGAALKNFVPQFAIGTQNFTGGTALVGERGPELVNLPAGSDVIPNNRFSELGTNGMQVFIPSNIIRGTDLVTVYNRANATNRRNG